MALTASWVDTDLSWNAFHSAQLASEEDFFDRQLAYGKGLTEKSLHNRH